MAKVSDITAAVVAEYLHIDPTDILIQGILRAAIGYACSYTGRTEAELDEFEEMYIAVLIKCSDYYDQRTEHTDKPLNNPTADAIFAMHSVNLLPKPDTEG